MLQVIDDSRTFRGWVGVEASFSPAGKRDDDMLGVFRMTDWPKPRPAERPARRQVPNAGKS
ncbi:hypothetical protein ACIQVC_06155 [Streptomyces sp. NPDC101112]|uniref:hypothetical protein n=1 Tax=Streptomyces sp. NPDC101112 TaxID=3366105 RepID=UPI00382B5C77